MKIDAREGVQKRPANNELRQRTEAAITEATRPEIAYLAVSELFRDDGEWVFMGAYINERNDGGGFLIRRRTSRSLPDATDH